VATRRQLERMAASRQRINSDPGASPIDILRRITEAIWEGIETNADLFRVMFRDPDAIENFADELWSGVTANAYQKFANTLRAAAKSGFADVADPEASSAVLIAALAYLPVVKLLIDRTPGDVDPERFRAAWLRLAGAAFTGAAAV